MRSVHLVLSDDAKSEFDIIKSKGEKFFKEIEEIKDDFDKRPYDMFKKEYKESRYDNHLLKPKKLDFPYIGYMSTHTFKKGKFRMVWKMIYSEEKNINELEESFVTEDVKEKCNVIIENNEKPVIVFVLRLCVDYHKVITAPEDLRTLLIKDSSSIALQANVRYPFLHKLVDEINEHPEKF